MRLAIRSLADLLALLLLGRIGYRTAREGGTSASDPSEVAFDNPCQAVRRDGITYPADIYNHCIARYRHCETVCEGPVAL